MKIGVLALHGDVKEHMEALGRAAKNLGITIRIILVRTKTELLKVNGLIIPGGESTTIHKLCEREKMFDAIKRVKAFFGTCAGVILLAKHAYGTAKDQKTLELMDITVERNSYGRQIDSFAAAIKTKLGKIDAVFIRAPRIKKIGNSVTVLAKHGNEVVACEQKKNGYYYMATCFHPELTTTVFHEYFLRRIKFAPTS